MARAYRTNSVETANHENDLVQLQAQIPQLKKRLSY